MQLTREEEFALKDRSSLWGYPRWRKTATDLQWHPGRGWIGGYVTQRRDGTWHAGRDNEGTGRIFTKLQDALVYTEWLYFRERVAKLESKLDSELLKVNAGRGRQLVPA